MDMAVLVQAPLVVLGIKWFVGGTIIVLVGLAIREAIRDKWL